MKSERYYLFYYDLRKYSYIENNNSFEIIYEELNKLHNMINEKILKKQFKLVKIITDNALYIVTEKDVNCFIQLLIEIKQDVDNYFAGKNFPCVLSMILHDGLCYLGNIEVGFYKTLNVCGPGLNLLGEYINLIDQTDDMQIFNNFVLTDTVYESLSEENKNLFCKKELNDKIVYVLI